MNLSDAGPYTGVTTGTLRIAETVATLWPSFTEGAIAIALKDIQDIALNGTQYRCVVTNYAGSVTSKAATLTVNYVPEITTQPASQAVAAGTDATFTIADAGNSTPAYQWQSSHSSSSTWTDIFGATSATLTVTNATDAMTGTQYRCVVTNSAGTATSNAATLYVMPDSATAAAQQLKIQLEATGTATVTVTGTVDLALVGGATVASPKNIVGADATSIITGGLVITAISNTTVINDNGRFRISPNNTVILGVNFNDGALIIDGANDVQISHCTFTDTPVSITGSADNIAFTWNKFTATAASGTGGGSAMRIDNADASTGILLQYNLWADGLLSDMPAVTNARVAMFNNYFTTTGNTTATIIGNSAQILSSNNIYQDTHNPLATQEGGLLRAFDNFMIATTGTVAPGDDMVFVPAYSYIMLPAGIETPGAGALADLITTNAGNTDGRNSVTPHAPANITARITATVSDGTANNLWISDGTVWFMLVTTVTLSNNSYRLDNPQPVVTGTNVPSGGSFTLKASASGFPPNPTSWQWYHDNFAIISATTASYTVDSATAEDAGVYTVALNTGVYSVAQVIHDNEIVTSGAFIVSVDEQAILTHPVSQTVTAGNSVTFTVVATGENLTYQWRLNGIIISGATGASYTITNARQGDTGSYSVVVSSSAGTAISNPATLTLTQPAAKTPKPTTAVVAAVAVVAAAVAAARQARGMPP